MNLEVNTKREENKHIVQLSGEIDVYTAPRLKETLIPISKQKGIEIIIDLSGIDYIDSTGLGVFIGTLKEADNNGSKLKIIGAKERISRLFSITGLDEVMEIDVDEKEED